VIDICSHGDGLKKGRYKVHSKFKKAVNLICDGGLVSLVDEEIGSGPNNIVVRGLDFNNVGSIVIDDKGLLLNEQRFDFDQTKCFDSRVDLQEVSFDGFSRNLFLAQKDLLENAPPKSLAFLLDYKRKEEFESSFEKEFVKTFEYGVKKIFSQHPLEGITIIKGAGFGLTPSGDDFVSGLLLAMNVTQRIFRCNPHRLIEEIYKSAKGGNPISNAGLLCAKQGLFNDRFKKLVLALQGSSDADISDSTRSVVSVGETSGADLVVGFLMLFKRRPAWLFAA